MSFLYILILVLLLSESDAKTASWREILKSLKENLDLETSCGYITLLNIAAQKRTKLRKMPNITTLACDTFESECDEEEGIIMKTEEARNADVFNDKFSNDGDNPEIQGNDLAEEIAITNSEVFADGVILNAAKDSNYVLNDTLNTSIEVFDTPPLSPVRGKILSSTSIDHVAIDDQWVVLQVSYGLPLFDSVLNKDICSKVRNK